MNENLPSTLDIITPIEAAEILQVSLATIYRWSKTDSTFPAIKVDKDWIIDRKRLKAWYQVNESMIEKSPSTFEFMTVDEAAEVLRVSLGSIYRIIQEDVTFPSVKLNKLVVDRAKLKEWYEDKFSTNILHQSEFNEVNGNIIEKNTLTLDIITLEETAEILHISEPKLCKIIRNDPTFPYVRIRGKRVVDRPRLVMWYEEKFSNKILPPLEFEEVPITEEEA